MKLEVGMYVRTNKGTVDKLDNKNIMTYQVALMGFGEKPIKASHNIIDLIEVGDYINGYKVVDIIHNNRKLEPSTMVYCEYGNSHVGFYNEDIKSVITKEQMEQMVYKVLSE